MKKAEAISILATSVRPREPKDRARYDEAVKMVIEALKCSETPKSSERTAETAQNVQDEDLISRKAAIEAICAICGNDCDKSEFIYDAPQTEQVILCPEHYALCALPSAQPQIIRCKDCKHRDKYGCCKYWKGLAMADIPIATDDNDFCSYAEQI